MKTGLAHRFALSLIARAGTGAKRVVFAFVIGTGTVSTVVSDVPTCAIFMAVALGMFEKLKLKPGQSNFGKAVMLAIPFASMIGGVATIAGSSINILGLQIVAANKGPAVSFLEWMAIGVPMVLILTAVVRFRDDLGFKPEIDNIGSLEDIKKELAALGPITPAEWKLISIQGIMLSLWILSTWYPQFNVVQVGGVFGAVVMFMPGIRCSTTELNARRAGRFC